jgi:hypothetical protein
MRWPKKSESPGCWLIPAVRGDMIGLWGASMSLVIILQDTPGAPYVIQTRRGHVFAIPPART